MIERSCHMSAFDYFTFQTEEQINRLQIYIEENFTLDATAKRLIRNILEYISVQEEDAEIILTMILSLLDGIGITETEIINAVIPDRYQFTEEEQQALFFENGVLDVKINAISSCSDATSLTWCETNCPKYSDCSTIALANEILAAYEQRLSDI